VSTPPSGALELAGGLLEARAGLRLDDVQRRRLARTLRRRARARGLPPAAVAADPAELQHLVDGVTVGETSFFRDPEHFTVLTEHVLPALAGPALVWSAGCADGREAWSLAIALAEAGAAGWHVLGTDISRAALAHAAAGEYPARALRGLSPARQAAFGAAGPDATWRAGSQLRARVAFLAHSLAGGDVPRAATGANVVFCRNVLIYLRRDHQDALLDALARLLGPGGVLLVGARETLPPDHRSFVPERVGAAYVYRPRAYTAARRPRRAGSTRSP